MVNVIWSVEKRDEYYGYVSVLDSVLCGLSLSPGQALYRVVGQESISSHNASLQPGTVNSCYSGHHQDVVLCPE